MANTVATHTVNAYPSGLDSGQRMLYLWGTVSFSAGNYVAGGSPTLGSSTCIYAAGSQIQITSNIAPVQIWYQSVGHPPSGYSYSWDQTAQTIRIFQGGAAVSSPLAEISGALPAGVTGDNVQFEATFVKD